MRMLLKILAIIFLIIVILCIWKTAEYFNSLPESNKWRALLAWDVAVLFIVAVVLIIILSIP